MDVATTFHRAAELFAERVSATPDDRWDAPTPCTDWTVRDLANHVTYEDVWAVALLEGATIEEVGDRFDGDLLGDDPVGAALTAARQAVAAVDERLPEGGTVGLSFGETPVEEYVMQLVADHLVHGWDLAVATGGDARLDPSLVHAVAEWFADREELYRSGGAIGSRRHLTGDAQHDLIARFGRDPGWGPHHQVLARFNAAFGSGDLDGALALCTDDIAFETTSPAPDGQRYDGRDAVRAVWADVLATPGLTFTEEESWVSGDRGFVRWQYSWAGDEPDDRPGHVRGVDVLRFRDGLLCEKFSYVKG